MRVPRFRQALLALGCLLAVPGCGSDPDENPAGSAAGVGGAGGGTGGTGDTGSAGGSGGAGGAGGSAQTGPIDGLVRRYDYAFDIATAHAKSRLAIEVAPPGGDCFDIHCALSTSDNVQWNDAPATGVALAGGALHACGEAVGPGATLSLASEGVIPEKTYLAGLNVGFSRTLNMAGGEFSYLLSWVGGCDRFGPCDDDPSRFAEFHFEVTHPAGAVVLCPGALTAGDTLTRCDLAGPTLAPTYSAFAVASDPLWKRTPFGTAAGVDLVFYEVPGGPLAASLELPSVTAFMQWITGLLGPFPYGNELRIAGAPTAWLGFEHPANIILFEDLPGYANTPHEGTMHVLMHEIVHQWAGDKTTLASVQDFVWKEATAEYLAYVFEDEQRPAGEAASALTYWDAISIQSKHYPRPTDDPAPAVQNFYGDVYGPGPMVLYVQLESMLGRPAVLDGIKAFLADQGARSVSDLRAALEAASGQDLGPYFDAWVFGSGVPEWPSFKVDIAEAGGEATVTVTQQNASGKLYGCAIEVEVKGATKTARAKLDFGLAPKTAAATAKVMLGEPVLSFTLDPDHRVVGRLLAANAAEPPSEKLRVWVF